MSSQTMSDRSEKDFIAIPPITLAASPALCVDLYVKADKDSPPVLYRDRNLEFPPEEFTRLSESGYHLVYIPERQVSDYQEHLRQHLREYINDESVPVTSRLLYLSEAGRDMLGEAFKSGVTAAAVKTAASLSDDIAAFVSDHDFASNEILHVLRHDYHTFTHSYNVANYCVLLAKGLGVSDVDELKQICVGGLLHDLGKLRIPLSILTKTQRLSDEDWAVIRQHPVDGFSELCQRDDISHGQLMMAYQHHEKLDGSGYPVGSRGEEIHPLARICTVVDIFEAVTSMRPYRKRMSIRDALNILQQEAGPKLDKEIVRCWSSLMTTNS